MTATPAQLAGGSVSWPEMVGYVGDAADRLEQVAKSIQGNLAAHEAWHRNEAEATKRDSRAWRLTLALVFFTAIGSIGASASAIAIVLGHG